jgi:hypothetical protein
VVEAFLDSPTFHFHVKHKLLDKFTGKYAALADGRFSSFVLEKAFKTANKSRRISIAQELSAAEEQLGRSSRGRIMLINLKISLFKRAQHIWEEKVHSQEKTKDLFADIVGDDDSAGSKKQEEGPASSQQKPSKEHKQAKEGKVISKEAKEPSEKRRRKEAKEEAKKPSEAVQAEIEELGEGKKKKKKKSMTRKNDEANAQKPSKKQKVAAERSEQESGNEKAVAT